MFNKTFSSFPQFSHLQIENKNEFNNYIKDYPALSDTSFATLFIWWDFNNDLEISTLNNNLIIRYTEAYDTAQSGLSLVGINWVDESIRTISDYLISVNKIPKLVHVPFFVIDKISDGFKHGLKIEEEINSAEYILDAKKISTLESSDLSRTRRKVRRFLREVDENVEVHDIDITKEAERARLINTMHCWDALYYSNNDPTRSEGLAISNSLKFAKPLEMKCLGVYVNNKLKAFAIYQMSINNEYLIVNHVKTSNEHYHIFDFVTQQIAIKALEMGIDNINFEMDLGIPGLRFHKQSLRPIKMLKKYSITVIR